MVGIYQVKSKYSVAVRFVSLLAVLGFLLTGLEAGAWQITDLANGTNYITQVAGSGGFTNNVYYSSYQMTNNSAVSYTNVWAKISAFTNGATPTIGVLSGSDSKKSLGRR